MAGLLLATGGVYMFYDPRPKIWVQEESVIIDEPTIVNSLPKIEPSRRVSESFCRVTFDCIRRFVLG